MDDTTTIAEATTSIADDDEQPLVFLHGICRQFRQGDSTLDVLRGAELAVWAGQSVALVGPSGAGKSTLLHIAGLLEHPDAGEVYIDAGATTHLSDIARTRIRRTEIGFVIGAIVCAYIEDIRRFMSWLTNTELFSPELYFLSQLPADMNGRETAAVVVMALGLSLLATLYPSWRAARLDPVEALRYE